MIAVTGATGFVGGNLLKRLAAGNQRVRALGRRKPEEPNVEFFRWESSDASAPVSAFEGCDAVVHLAGEPLSQRWNTEVKQRIRSTRVDGTRSIVRGLLAAGTPPRTLISASAIGYYGDRGDETLTETSSPGTGFLPDVCAEWEAAALEAGNGGVRVVLLRLGIVLGPAGGALARMRTPFRMGLGGPLGSGRQWMSWIHISDLVELILFGLMQDTLAGPVNAVAPGAVRNAGFTKALGDALRRPAVFPVPAFGLKLMFGEMASVMLGSARVVPEAAAAAGFRFRYQEVGAALRAALR
jgi:uncharacterized protein (TIGR01777 family)